MATRDVFTDEELDQLRRFPDISREELIRYFTLTPADEAFVVARHGAANRMGAAVQLCSLPWLGFVPDDVVSAPPVAVARLSERLRIPVGELVDYGSREQTRTDHLREVARYLGWRLAEEFQWRELDEFLFVLAHLWPTNTTTSTSGRVGAQPGERFLFFGTITVDIDGELAKLDTDGYRPLRHIPATASTVN